MQSRRNRPHKKGGAFVIVIIIFLVLLLFSLIGVLLFYLDILGNRDFEPPEIELPIVSEDIYSHYERLIAYSNIKYNTNLDFKEVLAFDLSQNENLDNSLDSILKSYDLFTKDEQTTIDFSNIIEQVSAFNTENNSFIDWRDIVSALTTSKKHLSDFLNIESNEIISLCKEFISEDGSTLILEQYLQNNNKTINYVDINFRERENIQETITIDTKKIKTLDEVQIHQAFTEESKELLNTKLTEIRDLSYTSDSGLDFISKIYHGAKSNEEDFKIFTSLTMAQAILESNWGTSKLYTEGKNIFGIKAFGDWTGETVKMSTEEYDPNESKNITIDDYFRKYDDFNGSIIDHSLFLVSNIRYTESGVFTAQNYKEQAKAIKEGGYATDPNYDTSLIELIEQNELFLFDD